MKIRLGFVSVDSGVVFIGDPSHTITGDAPHHIPTWEEWCGKTVGDLFRSDRDGPGVAEPAGPGLGMSFRTAWGDGSYPVFAEVAGGRILRVTIDFDCDGAEEGE